MRPRVSTLLAALGVALVLPAGASAATVAATDGTIAFTAASGEANNLTVSHAGGSVRFSDPAVSAMTAGPGCSVSGPQRVDCAAVDPKRIVVDLGDGNDRLSGQSLVPFSAYGGLGNDQIGLFGGDDVVDAGSGNDTVDTGWGDDTIDGGEGADSIGGGYGRDRVVYSSRSAAVSVSLDDVANDGASGEGDNVRPTVDDVTGGSGNDTLTGDDGANGLTGGLGDDVLSGAGGADSLDGGAGTDSFSGGAGTDSFSLRDGLAEALACGSEDDVAEADHDDVADADCEVVNRDAAPPLAVAPPVAEPVLPPTGGTGNVVEAPVAGISPSPLAVSAGGVAAVKLRCPSAAFEGCAGTILIEALEPRRSPSKLDVRSARRRRTKLASRGFKVPAGMDATIPVRLDRRSWGRFTRHRRVRVQITVTMENATGTTTATRTVIVKPSRATRR
jgi:hypothetical protein